MKQKILCIDARLLGCSGIGTYLENLIPRIRKLCPFTIRVIIPLDWKRESVLQGCQIIRSDAKIYSLKEQWLFSNLDYCDLFWTPHFNVPFFPIRAKKKLVTLHDAYHLANSSSLKFLEKAYAKYAFWRATKKSDLVITISKFSKNELIKYTNVSKEKIHIIPCAVDKKLFHKEKKSGDQLVIKSLDLPEDFFLYVGNIKPHKNVMTILKAFELFVSKYPKIHLVIVGNVKGLKNPDSKVIDFLEKRSKLLKTNIHFYSKVTNEELAIIYKRAKALILASFYEGFGLTPLEAMSATCVVIASNIASIKEVCENAALYFSPHSHEELFEKMQKILCNEKFCFELKKKGNSRLANFSWEEAAKKHLQVINKLIFDENSNSM